MPNFNMLYIVNLLAIDSCKIRFFDLVLANEIPSDLEKTLRYFYIIIILYYNIENGL